ncbi:hypothetical protein TNCV_1832081 [Trichonephila clavipes]|nr:hypothetical protein TNCV_1832081 [Trichonephila clavipes]
MIDVCNEVLRNFKTLGLECNQLVELLLVFSLQDKLEDSIKVKWELTLEDKNFPSLNKFLSFLEKQARSLQGIKITPLNEKSNKVSHKPYSLKTTVESDDSYNKVAAYATKRVELQLSPHFSQDIFAVNALVVKELTCNLPNFIVSKFDWPHINGLQLADPSFYIS